MRSKYSFENRGKYLLLRISGKFDYTEISTYLSMILEECKKEGQDKIMVNMLDMENTAISIIERFIIGEKMAEVLKRHLKIAVAFPAENINRLAETVASNRGVDIAVFADINNAEEWLLNKT
jgi:hypothetical protein